MKLSIFALILALAAIVPSAKGDYSSVTMSPGASAMVLSPDQKKIYVMGGGNLDVVDTATRTLERTVVVAPQMTFSAVCVNDTFGIVAPAFFFGSSPIGSNRVFLIDPTTFAVRSFHPQINGAADCTFSQDGKLLYLTSNTNNPGEPRISIVNADLNVVKLLKTNNGIRYITRSPKEDKFYAVEVSTMGNPYLGDGRLLVINGQEISKTVALPVSFYSDGSFSSLAWKVFFSPNGKFAYIPQLTGNPGGLVIIDTTADQLVDFKQFYGVTNGKFIDNATVYLLTGSSVMAWDMLSNWVLTTMPIPKELGEPTNVAIWAYGPEVIPGLDSDIVMVLRNGKVHFFEYQRPAQLKPPLVANGASFYVRSIVPGEIASVFGENLSTAVEVATGFPLPTELGRTKVLVNGIAAPLFYVSPTQINFQVPFETPSWRHIDVVVTPDTMRPGDQITLKVATTVSDIGAFSAEIDGAWRPIVVNASRNPWELVSPSHPVLPGEWITLYLTGLGAVSPEVPTGQPAPISPLSRTVNSATVKINAQEMQVDFCGLAPGWAGLYQINVQIPPDAQAGLQILQVQVSGTGGSSQYLLLPIGK